MSTLNFVIGELIESESKLIINNKTPWNLGVSFLEVLLVVFGTYTLGENIFGIGFSQGVGIGLIGLGIFLTSRPHLEELIFDKVQQEVMIIERRWFRLAKYKSQFPFSSIVGLNVKAERSESELLHFLWLDLGDGNFLAIGRTSDDRVSEIIKAICLILNFDESRVKR